MMQKNLFETLPEKLRSLRYEQRLEQVALVEAHPEPAERIKAAAAMIRQLSMHRVFDRFTTQQETVLLERLWPIAYPADGTNDQSQIAGTFSEGARSSVRNAGVEDDTKK